MGAAAADLDRLALARPHDRAHALDDHQHADDAEQDHVGEADGDVELAEPAQHREQPHAAERADDAADEQHRGERRIERAAAPVG